jgi:hypothetical protein
LRFGTYREEDSGTAAYAYMPGPDEASGDVWVNRDTATTLSPIPNFLNPVPGSHAYATLIHEIGHALGLKHPGDYGDLDSPPFLASFKLEDSEHFTVMSYNERQDTLYDDGGDSGFYASVHPSTPMLFDVAAIQFLYGANTNTASGDDTYSFGPTQVFLRNLWDAGGIDTLDAANWPRGVELDLRPGQFSSLWFENLQPSDPRLYWGKDNLSISYDTWIEHAIGSASGDTLIGNSRDNQLKGAAGNDTLTGGAGADTARFSGPRSAYAITQQADGRWQVADTRSMGSDGTDLLAEIETLSFSDLSVQLPATGRLSGQVYHWRSHSLLDSLTGSVQQPQDRLFSLRNPSIDADGDLRVELWANPSQAISNLDLELAFDGARSVRFSMDPALPASWTFLQSDPESDRLAVSAFNTQILSIDGLVRLGAIEMIGLSADALQPFSFIAGEAGSIRDNNLQLMSPYASALRIPSDTTDSDGTFDLGFIPFGTYLLEVSPPALPTGISSVITSADAMAALKLALGRNPNPDPDGPGPLKPLPISPYQWIAADLNADGKVTRADAQEILRIAQGQPTAEGASPAWVTIDESADLSALSGAASAAPAISSTIEVSRVAEIRNRVAILRGDVDGSWSDSPDSPTLDRDYFEALAATHPGIVTLAQFGLWPVIPV